MREIIIPGKQNCPYTNRGHKANPDHVYHAVKLDPSLKSELLQQSRGQRKVPVIVVWTGDLRYGASRGI
jgi:glutaredoxin 3